ncbi:hypothetical protein MCOR25_000155 [Pyricularia grisea]|nr:hypothetical protein MCOR25_000155 [Pyricularia grisea]
MAAVASAASQIAASRGLPIDTNTNTPSWVEQVPLPLDEDSRKLFIEYAKIPEAELEKHLIEAAHAGAPQTMLYGIDLIEHFFEAGKFLFRDPDVQITFRQADVLEPDALQDWHGNFSIVTCNYVFHLMGIEDQEKLAGAILKLLSGKPDDLVFGRTGGTEGEGRHEAFREDLKLYRHSTKSMEELWTRVAAKYGRKAVVESWIDPSPLPQSHWALAINKDFEPVRNLIFSVRLS